jgi:hypothetical protein
MLFQRSACRVPDIAPCDGLNLLLGVLQSGGNVLDEQVGHYLGAAWISLFSGRNLRSGMWVLGTNALLQNSMRGLFG